MNLLSIDYEIKYVFRIFKPFRFLPIKFHPFIVLNNFES